MKGRTESLKIRAKCVNTSAKSLYVLWFYKMGTHNQSADVFFFCFLRSCFYLVLLGQVRENLGKWCLKRFDLKKCAQHEKKCSRFFEAIFFEYFSCKFGEIWAKILRTPKNLPATPVHSGVIASMWVCCVARQLASEFSVSVKAIIWEQRTFQLLPQLVFWFIRCRLAFVCFHCSYLAFQLLTR